MELTGDLEVSPRRRQRNLFSGTKEMDEAGRYWYSIEIGLIDPIPSSRTKLFTYLPLAPKRVLIPTFSQLSGYRTASSKPASGELLGLRFRT